MSDREVRFTEFYGRTRPQIVAYALRRTSSPEDAADVVAETFETAWRRFDDVPTGKAGLLWLYVTARNVLSNHGRRIRRRTDVTVRLVDELRRIPPQVDASDEASVVMQSCFLSLPEEDREVLMLAGWEGLSATEIARVLGCSATAARIRLHRARVRLRTEMEDHVAPAKRTDESGHTEEGHVDHGSTPEEVRRQ